MKRSSRLFIAALAAFGLASCSQELDQQIQTPQGNLVTVNFGAEAAIEGATKATLTPNEDDTFFKSAWENGDALGVQYYNDGMEGNEQVVHATWNETSYSFSTALPEFTGRWIYRAAYPAPEADGSVEFGSSRTQKGNAYNSKYDLMRGSVMTEAPAGKTDEGKDIIFDMTRETAIAYFHFTSKLAEKVVSAKLSVTGGSIANSSVTTDYHNSFVFSDDKPLDEITITFEEGSAPDATEFMLWYNVRPTSYSSMTLEVETTGHKMTINRNSEGVYKAGRLYKVVKDIDDKWVAKGSETPGTKDFVLVTSAQSDWSGSYLLVGANDVNYYAFDESVYENSTWGKCSKVVVENNTIASTYSTMAVDVVPGTTENTYSILTPSGKYLSASAKGAFNLDGTYSADNCDFTISFDAKNVLVIKQASSTKNRQIRYNYNNGNGGLRWYEGTSVEPVYLYKGPSIAKYLVSFASVEGGTLSASAIKAEEGTEITLTAEPLLGYEFNNDWSVTATDGTIINVVNNKFTMPAQDVTVSGTFSESTSTPTFASLAELVATGAPSTTAAKVTVTLTNEEITNLHKVTTKTGKTYTNGVFLMVGTQEVEVYCRDTPSDWKVGGTISGTLTNCDWKLFVDKNTQKATWELCPADYSELTYKAPLPTCATPVITIDDAGVVSIACETAGTTIHYTVGDNPADPTEADAVFNAVTLTDSQTIKAIAFAEGYKPSAVASKKYTVGGLVEYVSTFTDKDLNTKEKTMTWKSSIDALAFESAATSRGVQFGSAKGEFTITGTGHKSNVKKISVIISTNNAGNTISATVGGKTIGKMITLTKKNNYEIVFESETELSGNIVFNVNDKNKSVYIKSITVNPSSAN